MNNNLALVLINALGGLLYTLGFPTNLHHSLLVTPLIGIGILLWHLGYSEGFKKKALALFSFNLAFTLSGFYWITHTFMEFGKLPFIIAFLLNFLFCLFVTPHYLVLLIGISLKNRFPIHKRALSLPKNALALFIAFILTSIEYFTPQQFPIFIGQPWLALGNYLGLAPMGGIPLYSFFSFLVILIAIDFIRTKTVQKLNLAFVIGFIILNPLSVQNEVSQSSQKLNIRLVQANISNFLKTDSEKGGRTSSFKVINRYKDMSLRPSKEPLDLIIWPETAYPFSILKNQDEIGRTHLPLVFYEVAEKGQAELFIGGYEEVVGFSSSYQSDYNSSFHVSSEGELKNIYHKHILIPFGETLPFPSFVNQWLAHFMGQISFFKEGEGYPLFTVKERFHFIKTICYEVLKPEFLRDYLNNTEKRPHAIINLTNDSWYGKTSEPWQHLFLTQWRSLEFNLPLIRSTNTGVSAVIDHKGQVTAHTGVFKTENLDFTLNLRRTEPTLYQSFGFLVTLLTFLLLFIIQLLLKKVRER